MLNYIHIFITCNRSSWLLFYTTIGHGFVCRQPFIIQFRGVLGHFSMSIAASNLTDFFETCFVTSNRSIHSQKQLRSSNRYFRKLDQSMTIAMRFQLFFTRPTKIRELCFIILNKETNCPRSRRKQLRLFIIKFLFFLLLNLYNMLLGFNLFKYLTMLKQWVKFDSLPSMLVA